MGVHKQSLQPGLFFYLYSDHGREEWVLVELGSQHKRVKRPVWPVFPDYLSISCGYDKNYKIMSIPQLT